MWHLIHFMELTEAERWRVIRQIDRAVSIFTDCVIFAALALAVFHAARFALRVLG